MAVLAFETLRPTILLSNNAGGCETEHLKFDLFECLNSVELTGVHLEIKQKICSLTPEQLIEIKELFF